MKLLLAAWIISFSMIAGCSAEPKNITGTVVDAETGQPIEGAVVLVEWTKAEGVPGLASTKSFKVVEAITDKNGEFTCRGLSSKHIDPPDITIYKKGYVAWNDKLIFPTYKKRLGFKYQDGNLIKLEHFNNDYSYIEHQSFIDSAARLYSSTEMKGSFLKAYNDYEREKVIKERQNKTERRR